MKTVWVREPWSFRAVATLAVLPLIAGTFLSCRLLDTQECSEDRFARREGTGPCLARVDRHMSSITVTPRRECEWEKLVDLRVFSGFKPGMTFREARSAFGDPDAKGHNSWGPFWKYQRPLGVVQVGDEDQGSTILPVDRLWVLRAYPADSRPEAWLSKEVIPHLPLNEEHLEVVILNGCRYPMIELILERGRIKLVTWIKNPGSYHPPAGGKRES
jgi:hypothetical protein